MTNFLQNFACRQFDGNIVEAVVQEETLGNEVEPVREFTYPGDNWSAGVGCEVAVTARTRCWWVMLRDCGELLYGDRFFLKLIGTVYWSYV